MTLADSKIFPGNDSTLDPKKAVRKQQKIFVYVPAAYPDDGHRLARKSQPAMAHSLVGGSSSPAPIQSDLAKATRNGA
jgi:hypothetical protein